MNFWQTLPRPIVGLSPMDGVTDAPFRFIAAKYGAPDVTITEFVNVEAALFAPRTLIKDLTYSEIERPAVAQIYGHTPDLFYRMAHIVCALGFDGLDINMGCPAKKVASKGSGAGLIRTPELAKSVIRAARRGIADWHAGQTLEDIGVTPELCRLVETTNRARTGGAAPPERRSIPVSVKTRLGYDEIVVEDWLGALLEEVPAAISLHGRTLKQGYKGEADWAAIGRAAAIVKKTGALILGNGDLKNMEDVRRRVNETRVDGVLLGRAAQGNPWIFRAKDALRSALRRGEVFPDLIGEPVTLGERFAVLIEHSRRFERHWGKSAFVGMRKHLAWYYRCLPRAAELRYHMVRVNDVAEIVARLEAYTASLAPEPRLADAAESFSSCA
jgi:tRNA-dihydrouridine synthase